MRVRVLVGAGAALAVAAAGGLGVHAYVTTASLGTPTPAAGAAVADRAPRIVVPVSNESGLGRYTLLLDGRDVTTRSVLDGAGIVLAGVRLPDGAHSFTVRATADGLFGGPLRRSWSFTVDTRPPPLRLDAVPAGWVRSHTLGIAGVTQPGASVTATGDLAAARAVAGADGRFALSLDLGDGAVPVSIVASDAAGNRTERRVSVRVDATAPRITSGLGAVVTRSRPTLRFGVTDVSPTRVRATLDGKPVKAGVRLAARLAQGRHVLRISARDAAGNTARSRIRFVVDSTEKLGSATLISGARGDDVRALQHMLRREGYLKPPPTGVYGAATLQAVHAFQTANHLPVDGAAGPYTIAALSGHIVIDQSSHTLTLYRFDRPALSFPVAVGQPAYPTPNGHFYIISMVKDPTWTPPPDAPWAQGAVPIPPGPGNPLGTRWMGLSAPGVGIHGTDDPSSIGYSVSHGCIRMHVPDAERLFTMVAMGMSVVIQP